MPLHWIIDHNKQRVRATLLEDTTEQEMYEFLGEVIAQDAMRYAKVFDAIRATKWILSNRVGPIAATARLYSRMKLGPIGPLAIVVSTVAAIDRANEYILLADAARQVRLFKQAEHAEAWLNSAAEADSTQARK